MRLRRDCGSAGVRALTAPHDRAALTGSRQTEDDGYGTSIALSIRSKGVSRAALRSSLVARYFDVHPGQPSAANDWPSGRLAASWRAGRLPNRLLASRLAASSTTGRAWSGFERSDSWTTSHHHARLRRLHSGRPVRPARQCDLSRPSRPPRRGSTPSSCRQREKFPDECCIPRDVQLGVRIPDHWSPRRSWRA